MQTKLSSQQGSARLADDERLERAVEGYAQQQMTLGQAAELVGVTQVAFRQELARRQIPVNYGIQELNEDLQAAQEITQAIASS